MRTIERTSQFKRDYKREMKGRNADRLDSDLMAILHALAHDDPLPARSRDHGLTGDWTGHRDCHIRPDLVLIYRKPTADILQLVRLGSHSELGF